MEDQSGHDGEASECQSHQACLKSCQQCEPRSDLEHYRGGEKNTRQTHRLHVALGGGIGADLSHAGHYENESYQCPSRGIDEFGECINHGSSPVAMPIRGEEGWLW